MKLKNNLYRLLLFALFIAPMISFSQTTADFEKEIAQLKGKEKAEKYIELIDNQKTRSPQISIKLGEQALQELSQQQFPSERARILYLLGDSYYLTGDYTKALPLLQQSVNAYEKLDKDEELAIVYIALGRFYKKVQNDCKNSLEYYKKAEKTYEKKQNRQELATVHNYLGNLTESCEQDLDKALSYYYKTEKYYTEVKDTIGLSYSLDFISQVYGQQEKYAEAVQKQTKALELRLAIDDSFAIAISYANLGELYLMQKNATKAKNEFEKASSIASTNNFRDLNVYLLGKLSDICLEQNNPIGAYEYLKEQKELQNSMLDEEKHKQLAEMKTKFDTEKKELALEEEQIKNKNKTLLLLVLIGAILILIVIIALVLQRRKMDKQQATISILQNLETERTRIARDLHDNLGAELTMISSKLDLKAFKTTNEADKKDLTDIREISTNANFVLRETIWSIHKEELTVDELYRKAEEYAKRILESKEIRSVVVATEKEAVLSPAIALHLFRIIQEAVNNAAKYSNCSEVKLFISPSRIEIYDNGNGFDTKNVKSGYGLQNMQQRAKECNGTIRIESEVGKGTSVVLDLRL